MRLDMPGPNMNCSGIKGDGSICNDILCSWDAVLHHWRTHRMRHDQRREHERVFGTTGRAEVREGGVDHPADQGDPPGQRPLRQPTDPTGPVDPGWGGSDGGTRDPETPGR